MVKNVAPKRSAAAAPASVATGKSRVFTTEAGVSVLHQMKTIKLIPTGLLLSAKLTYGQQSAPAFAITHPALLEAIKTYKATQIARKEVLIVSFYATDSSTTIQVSAVMSDFQLVQNKPVDLLFIEDKLVILFLPQILLAVPSTRRKEIDAQLVGRLRHHENKEHWSGINYDPER